jgi:hypothetical protein
MHKDQYSEARIKRAIRCYYITKASSLGAVFKDEYKPRKLMESYISGGDIPTDISSMDLLCVLLADIDKDLYDLSYKEKRERLVQLRKDHFGDDDKHTHDKLRSLSNEDIV